MQADRRELFLFLLFCGLGLQLVADDLGVVAYLLHGGLQLLDVGLRGVVGYGDGLVGDAGLDLHHAFLEAEVLLDLVLAVLAVHLRRGRHHQHAEVFSYAHEHQGGKDY